MSKKKGAAGGAAVRRPRPAPRPFIDARLLLVAALIASPAVYRSTQGLLSPSAAMDRFLIIAAGCLVLAGLVRTIWPLVVGEPPPASGSATTKPATAETTPISGLAIPAVGSGVDLLEDLADPAELLQLGE